jgi:hypothetical protein
MWASTWQGRGPDVPGRRQDAVVEEGSLDSATAHDKLRREEKAWLLGSGRCVAERNYLLTKGVLRRL